jgi:transposase
LGEPNTTWLFLQRQIITDRSATAKALDYSLKRWAARTQFLDDVLARLPTQKNSQIDELLPHRWQPTKP